MAGAPPTAAAGPAEALVRAVKTAGLGGLQPVYLVSGDLVLAEPGARSVAAAVAELAGCEVVEHRRPANLRPLLEDLRTLSMFESAKSLLVVDSAVLADRKAAASLIDDAVAVLPRASEGDLSSKERQAASRLLQALRLFDVDPHQGAAEAVIGDLPAWALQGGGKQRARTKKKVEELRKGLTELLEATRETDLVGFAEDPLADLGAILESGLPDGHCLVLAERAVADGHPLVKNLKDRGALLDLGKIEAAKRGGWEGLDRLVDQLSRETGVTIARDAAQELARRTLRQSSDWKSKDGAEADSTARFAGEFRKLATLARDGCIERRMVAETVLDRGEEDVWQILDAIGAGQPGAALGRLRRLMGASRDLMATRLSFFTLLASFCRQLTAVRGMMRVAGVRGGERNYARFKDRVAPVLQGELPAGAKNPLAGLHPFRLHRAYLAASRLPERRAAELPWTVLETELLIKGESRDPEAALEQLVLHLTGGGPARRR